MSNEQNPNPWSRDGGNDVDASGPDEPTTPAHSTAHSAQQPVRPEGPAGDGHGFAQQGIPTQGPARLDYPPPAYPFGPPTASFNASPTPTTSPKSRSRVAGLLAVAVLAAGVGGAAGFGATLLTTRYAANQSSTILPTQTQVVQADPNSPNWTAVAAAASSAVVAIQVRGQDGSAGQGSGVVIDGEGHIVTNNHVVSGSGSDPRIVVLLGDTSYVAEMVGTDPSTDLAVIRLADPPSALSVMSFADERELAVGDPVMAIGNPLGLADTVTTGIVSALNRPVTTRAVSNNNRGPGQRDLVVTAAIQTNAAINPGNSGGALVNAEGELVGVTTSIATLASSGESAGNIGIGFAIGADQVQYVAEQLIANGVAEHPQIGVSARDSSTTGRMGAVIAEVVPGSPAAAVGMQVDDLVTRVNGNPVTSTESLVALVRAGRVGREMTLTVLRDGEELELVVTPVAAAR